MQEANRSSPSKTHSIATQGRVFGQFPGNSVIAACPEMNAGEGGVWRVVCGGFVKGGEGKNL